MARAITEIKEHLNQLAQAHLDAEEETRVEDAISDWLDSTGRRREEGFDKVRRAIATAHRHTASQDADSDKLDRRRLLRILSQLAKECEREDRLAELDEAPRSPTFELLSFLAWHGRDAEDYAQLVRLNEKSLESPASRELLKSALTRIRRRARTRIRVTRSRLLKRYNELLDRSEESIGLLTRLDELDHQEELLYQPAVLADLGDEEPSPHESSKLDDILSVLQKLREEGRG